MVKFSFKDTIGYKYWSECGDCVIIQQVNECQLKIKLLEHPNFISSLHPEWGEGYACLHIESLHLERKTPYLDESLTIMDIVKAQLTLK